MNNEENWTVKSLNLAIIFVSWKRSFSAKIRHSKYFEIKLEIILTKNGKNILVTDLSKEG